MLHGGSQKHSPVSVNLFLPVRANESVNKQASEVKLKSDANAVVSISIKLSQEIA